MAWIRLSDDYIDDEKMTALSDGAFRLWHEGLAYCRRKKTDGLIPFTVMRGFRYYSKGREKELARPARASLSPLWNLVPAMGYSVHNYLDWNLSKEEEENEKAGSAARMRKFRGGRYAVTPTVTNGVTSTVTPPVTSGVTNANVPDGIGIGKVTKKKEGDARSKRPIFTGQRLTVFEWMLDDLCRMLGQHADTFDLDEWFYEADRIAAQQRAVVPDWWPWLKAQTLAEAKRRGLVVASAETVAAEDRAAKEQRERAELVAYVQKGVLG